MKKIWFIVVLLLTSLRFLPIDVAYGQKGSQVVVPDTVRDPHSKYTARFLSYDHRSCTAILIASNVALTAKHCGGSKVTMFNGTIYPAASGDYTPFGYMNVRDYIPHPNPKFDIALLKGTLRDQDKFYKYYIRPFKTTVRGYTDEQLKGMVGKEVYSYGYPGKYGNRKQYRSDGKVTTYQKKFPYLRTSMPGYSGQSGSGAFLKNGEFIGILVTRTKYYRSNVLPFTTDIAEWINKNAK